MKAFFFDRDGTLNIDTGYINNPDQMEIFYLAKNVLRYIKSLGYLIFVITNQSGIGRGLIKPEEYRSVNNKFLYLINGNNLIDDILYCPHTPQHECLCRKPNTLLLKIVKEHYDIDCNESYFVGDKITDLICAKRVGLHTIMICNNRLLNDKDFFNYDKKIVLDKTIKSIAELLDIINE